MTVSSQYLFEHDLLDQSSTEFHMLLESRIDFLKQQYPTHHTLIDYLAAEADPTPNKKYTEWLTQRAVKGDLPTTTAEIRRGLELFSKAKSSAHDTNIKNHTMQSMLDTAHVVKHTMREAVKPLDKIYDKDGVTAFVIPNKETSIKMYGPGSKHETNWCTAANSSDNRFNDTPGNKITMHFPSGRFLQFNHSSAQMKDEKNNDVDLAHPDFRPYYQHIKDVVHATVPHSEDTNLHTWNFPESGDRYYEHSPLTDHEIDTKIHDYVGHKIASNKFLEPHQYEKVFEHAKNKSSLYSFLSVNKYVPQHLIDTIPHDQYHDHHVGFSPEKVHSIIDSAKAFWTNQDSHDGNVTDARMLSEMAKNPLQKFDGSHVDKIASFPESGQYAADVAIRNIGINNRLPAKHVDKAFRQLSKVYNDGLRATGSGFTHFLNNNQPSHESLMDAVKTASRSTAFQMLGHKALAPEHNEKLIHLLKIGHISGLVNNLDHPNIPHDIAKDELKKDIHSDLAFVNYTQRKDSHVEFVHQLSMERGEQLDHYSAFYERKLPVHIGAHPMHVWNTAYNLSNQKHYTKDDLHQVIDLLHKKAENAQRWPSSKMIKHVINHPNSNSSHYEKLFDRFGKHDLMMRNAIDEHEKVPSSVKAKMV